MSATPTTPPVNRDAGPIAVEIPMRDGVVLRGDLHLPPEGTGPRPVLLRRTPYRKEGWADMAAELAAGGYAVLVQDIRGRGSSDGDFVWSFDRRARRIEADDGIDTIAWCAAADVGDGRVGTWGHSYDGWTQLCAAVERPAGLAAMFVAGISPQSQQSTRGLVDIGRRMEWCYALGADLERQRRVTSGVPVDRDTAVLDRWQRYERGKWLWFLPIGDLPRHALTGATDLFRSYVEHPTDEVWELARDLHRIDVPVAVLTGWWDRFSEAVELYAGLPDRTRSEGTVGNRLVIGPWSHHPETAVADLGDLDTGGLGGIDYTRTMLDWFDECFSARRDVSPPVRYFTVGRNEWREAATWPPPGGSSLELHLRSDGDAAGGDRASGRLRATPAGDEPADVYRYDPRDPVMSIMAADSHLAPLDQAPNDSRPDIARYLTEPLTEPLEVTGRPEVVLWASSDAPDTDWVVRLVDVPPSGPAIAFSTGVVRASLRRSLGEPLPIEPGVAVEYTIPLSVASFRLGAGHRLRLDVTSSDFPNIDRHHNTWADQAHDAELRVAEQRIHHDDARPSRVVLPIGGLE